MTSVQQKRLQVIAKRYRWTLVELVIDQKMIEANEIYNVRKIKKYLKTIGSVVPSNQTDLEEALMIAKTQEAKLIITKISTMYEYLKTKLGSGVQVLQDLEHVLRTQPGPRKAAVLSCLTKN